MSDALDLEGTGSDPVGLGSDSSGRHLALPIRRSRLASSWRLATRHLRTELACGGMASTPKQLYQPPLKFHAARRLDAIKRHTRRGSTGGAGTTTGRMTSNAALATSCRLSARPAGLGCHEPSWTPSRAAAQVEPTTSAAFAPGGTAPDSALGGIGRRRLYRISVLPHRHCRPHHGNGSVFLRWRVKSAEF